MARVRMITRTVNVTKCATMCLTISTAAVTTDILKVNGTFENTDDALKAIKKQYETADYKPTAIVKMVVDEILYGMPEEKFIQFAEILPPRKGAEKDEPAE